MSLVNEDFTAHINHQTHCVRWVNVARQTLDSFKNLLVAIDLWVYCERGAANAGTAVDLALDVWAVFERAFDHNVAKQGFVTIDTRVIQGVVFSRVDVRGTITDAAMQCLMTSSALREKRQERRKVTP